MTCATAIQARLARNLGSGMRGVLFIDVSGAIFLGATFAA
jgi:hypothetical protein